MKKILVPVDFSIQSQFASKIAAEIAKYTNAKLFLLHLLEIPTSTIDPSNYGSSSNSPSSLLYLKRAKKKFTKLKKEPFFDGVKFEDAIIFQNNWKGIIDESKNNDVDLIIMGSQGVSGLEEILVGSTTEKVVRNSEIPVMVIKEDIKDFELNNLVYISDFHKGNELSFQKIIDFTKIFKAKLHLLKIITIQNFETSKTSTNDINNFIDGFDIKNYSKTIYNDVSVEAGALNFAKSIDADAILLNTHGRRGLSHLFRGSIGEDLANHAKLPVVTFKLKK